MNESKALVLEYLAALSGMPKDTALIARYVSDSHLAEHIATCEAAFPSYELRTEDLVAEGNLISLRATFQGTHTGTFFGVPPTGRTASVSLMIFYRVEGRKIVQSWIEMDSNALMKQLTAQATPAHV
jgi:predicted ester cyclase